MRLTITLIFCLATCQSLLAIDEIVWSFEIVGNRIVVQTENSGVKLNLIFDTASNVSILDSTVATDLKLHFGTETQTLWITGNLPGYSTYFEFYNPLLSTNWIIVNMNSVSENLDFPIHGLIGASNLLISKTIEIDFENSEIRIDENNSESVKSGISLELIACNKSIDGLGKAFPQFPAIECNINFNDSISKKVNLIIDTGCQYGLLFFSNDSITINKIISSINNYKLFNTSKKVGFCDVDIGSGILEGIWSAPLFLDKSSTSLMNIEFYGLLGVPILKQYKMIILDWSKKKVYFITK